MTGAEPVQEDAALVALIDRLGRSGLDLTYTQVVEALWLAQHLAGDRQASAPDLGFTAPVNQHPGATDRTGRSTDSFETQSGQISSSQGSNASSSADSTSEPSDVSKASNTANATDHAQDTSEPSGVSVFAQDTLQHPPDSSDFLEFRSPGVSALQNALELGRALRPLTRKVPSRTQFQLDSEATVEQIIEKQIWHPVQRPTLERWFDLELVIEDSPLLFIWEQGIREFEQQVLAKEGAFRHVRVWLLRPEGHHPVLHALPQIGCWDKLGRRADPGELVDAVGRSLIIVLSEGRSALWQESQRYPGRGERGGVPRNLHAWLDYWGKSASLLLMQLLPEWLWEKRSAVGHGFPAQFASPGFNPSNQQLFTTGLSSRQRRRASLSTAIKVPVLTLDDVGLGVWAQVITGAPGRVPGVVFSWEQLQRLQSDALVLGSRAGSVLSPLLELEPATELSEEASEAAVRNFLVTASPGARQLAGLMAAVPVSLPVIHLLQARFLRSPSPVQVAEVFMSGLIQRLPGTQMGERAIYDFRSPAIRKMLLEVASPYQTQEVIQLLSQEIGRKLGQTSITFGALLSPERHWLEREEDSEQIVRRFAELLPDVLLQMGGAYATLAETALLLREPFPQQQQSGGTSPGTSAEVEFPDLPPLEELVVESPRLVRRSEEEQPDTAQAETEDWPPIHEETVQSTKLELDETPPEDWPALEQETLIMKTVEFEEEPEADLGVELERFSYQIAEVRQERGEWRVFYSPGDNNRYIERLESGDQSIDLEMVQIPAGQFWMGSDPKTDPGHDSSEAPKHGVQVPPFFLGRYPVTQAQWRVVASWDKVKQDLDPDPSNFKGADRPVERVSWHDAVEFCARLAQRAGRDYRLPSEAEWEYACRAGTTTPFSFGEMITTEVANYNGRAWQSGPQGRGRGGTTAVGSVGGGNAWGLSDMHGNVWEWCADPWHGNYEGAPTDGSAWEEGKSNDIHVLRGGSWFIIPRSCRSAGRDHYAPGYRNRYDGFRLACSPRGSSLA